MFNSILKELIVCLCIYLMIHLFGFLLFFFWIGKKNAESDILVFLLGHWITNDDTVKPLIDVASNSYQ